MLRRRPQVPRLELLLHVDRFPAEGAVEELVRIGCRHGRKQNRWQPIYHLLESAALVAQRRLEADTEGRKSSMQRTRDGLGSERVALSESLGSSQPGFGPPTIESNLDHEELQQLREFKRQSVGNARLKAIEGQIATIEADIQRTEAELPIKSDVIWASAQALWDAYRVSYAENLPGPPDAKRALPWRPLPPMNLSAYVVPRPQDNAQIKQVTETLGGTEPLQTQTAEEPQTDESERVHNGFASLDQGLVERRRR